jgi:hypothetical protein
MTNLRLIAAASGGSTWLGVDWGSIALVFVVSLIATVLIATSFAFATRLLAVGAPDIEIVAGGDPDAPDAIVRPRLAPRPMSATIGAGALFAVGIAATLYGVYLVIPYFHQ